MDLRFRILHRFSRAGLRSCGLLQPSSPRGTSARPVERFPNSIADARNGEVSVVRNAEAELQTSNTLHFSGTGMSGHHFPTVGKFLQIHGGVTHYLLLCGGKRD